MALRLGIRRRWLRFGEVSELCCAVCPSDADCNCCFLCFTTTHPPTVPLATKRQQKIYHVANFCLYRQILIVTIRDNTIYAIPCNTMQHDEMHHHFPLLSHSMQYWTYQVNVGWQRNKPFCVAHLCVSVCANFNLGRKVGWHRGGGGTLISACVTRVSDAGATGVKFHWGMEACNSLQRRLMLAFCTAKYGELLLASRRVPWGWKGFGYTQVMHNSALHGT